MNKVQLELSSLIGWCLAVILLVYLMSYDLSDSTTLRGNWGMGR